MIFNNFKRIRSFCDSIYNNKITISEVNKKQNNLLINILDFNGKSRSRSKVDQKKIINTLENVNAF